MNVKRILIFAVVAVNAAFSQAPSIVSVAPNSGSGLAQTFTITISDPTGGSNVVEVDLMINQPSGTFGVNACHVVYYPQWNEVTLHNDSDTAPYVLAYLTPGQSGTVNNSQCTLNGQGVTKSINGTQFTATFQLTFSTAWAGARQINAYAQNAANYVSGWVNKGNWTVPGPTGPPVINSVTPNSGTGISQTFTIVVADPTNGNNIVEADVMIGEYLGNFGAHACHVVFFPGWNLATLATDDGTGILAPAVTPGQPGTVSNSQCTLSGQGITKTINGNLFTASFPVTFSGSWVGPEYIDAYAQTFANFNSGWIREGLWTIPTMPDQIIGYVKESAPTLNPGEVNMSRITLSQAGQDLDTMALRVYHGNDSITFRIRYAKPNSQVWVTRIATVPAGAPAAGTSYVQTVCGPDNGHQNQGLQQATLDPVNGDRYGACYLGMTDSTGYLEWTGNIWYSTAPQTFGEHLSGMISAQFYIGPQTFNPNFPGITDGPMNEDNYVGALVYWVIGSDGYQGPAPY